MPERLPENCKKEITGIAGYTAEQIAATNKQRYGKCLCVECGQKAKAAQEAKAKTEPENDIAAQLMAEAEE